MFTFVKGIIVILARVQVQFANNAKINILISSPHQKWSIYIDKYLSETGYLFIFPHNKSFQDVDDFEMHCFNL